MGKLLAGNQKVKDAALRLVGKVLAYRHSRLILIFRLHPTAGLLEEGVPLFQRQPLHPYPYGRPRHRGYVAVVILRPPTPLLPANYLPTQARLRGPDEQTLPFPALVVAVVQIGFVYRLLILPNQTKQVTKTNGKHESLPEFPAFAETAGTEARGYGTAASTDGGTSQGTAWSAADSGSGGLRGLPAPKAFPACCRAAEGRRSRTSNCCQAG